MAEPAGERAYYTLKVNGKTGGEKPKEFRCRVLVKAAVKPEVLRETLTTLFSEVPEEVTAIEVANAVKEAIGETQPYGVMIDMDDMTFYWVSKRDYRYLLFAAS